MPASTRKSSGEGEVVEDKKAKRLRRLQAKNEKYVEELIRKATHSELTVKAYLDRLGCNYIFQHGILKPYHRIFDFYFPDLKSVLEIDGSSHAGNEDKDYKKDREILRLLGIRTFRITNKDVWEMRFQHTIHEILMGTAQMALPSQIVYFGKKKRRKLPSYEPTAKEIKKDKRKRTKVHKFVRSRSIKPETLAERAKADSLAEAMRIFYG